MWRSLVAHLHGVQGVEGSNPFTPTISIKDLASKGSKSFLVVEQDVVTALELSSTAYAMDMGKIVRGGRSQELLHDPAIRQAYLGALAT